MKDQKLTDEQRVNMMNLGIGTTHKTTEGEVLKVLRKRKFENFGKNTIKV